MSKGTENFKKVIQKYLEMASVNDAALTEALQKPEKNIDDCVNYILNTVKNSGCNGFLDKEIFGLALNYYNGNVVVGPKISSNVVVNHQIELSAEEIAQAKQKAFDKIVEEEKARLLKKKEPAKKTEVKPTSEHLGGLFE